MTNTSKFLNENGLFKKLEELTLKEKAEIFISNWENYEAIFPEEVLEHALSMIDIKEFITTECYRDMHSHYYDVRYPRVRDEKEFHTFQEYKGDYSRDVRELAYRYYIPCRYQIYESKFLEICLSHYIDLDRFSINMYHLEAPDSYVFLQIPNSNSLYIPVNALIKRDINTIIESNKKYLTSYHSKKEDIEKNLKMLERPEVKEFFEYLKKNPNRITSTHKKELTKEQRAKRWHAICVLMDFEKSFQELKLTSTEKLYGPILSEKMKENYPFSKDFNEMVKDVSKWIEKLKDSLNSIESDEFAHLE